MYRATLTPPRGVIYDNIPKSIDIPINRSPKDSVQSEHHPMGDVQNPILEVRSFLAKSTLRARHLDLKAFVPNNLFLALPLTNRSGLFGRYNQ